MNEQQEKVKFRQAIDHTLTSLEGNPFLYQRVVARAEEGEKKVKKHKWNLGLVIVLAMMACMVTAAAAGGWFGGYVNWNGDIIPEERPSVVAGPTAAPEMASGDFRQAIQLVSTAGDCEVVLVYETNGYGGTSSSSNRLTRRVEGYQAFLTIMADAPMLPVPDDVPEGYVLAECSILYECRKGGAYVLTSSENLDGGVVVERYGVAEEDLLIRGYDLTFRNPEDSTDYIAVWASLSERSNPADHRFGVNPDQTAQIVQVPGMDNAIAITSETHTCLSMRRTLPEVVRYQAFDMGDFSRVGSFGEVRIDVRSRLAGMDALAALFVAE